MYTQITPHPLRSSYAVGLFLLAVIGLHQPAIAQKAEQEESVQRLKRGTSETLSAAGSLAAETKEQTQRRLEKELKKLDGSMDDLKTRLEKAGSDAKVRIIKQLPELERRKEELGAKLEDLKTRSGQAWDDMATGTEAALKELRKSFDKAKSRFE